MAEAQPLARITVEVAYAESGRQFLRSVELAAGATIADAIAASGIGADTGVDVATLTTGIWSKPAKPATRLQHGDRVELYRPLKADPKESRRRRAERTKKQRG